MIGGVFLCQENPERKAKAEYIISDCICLDMNEKVRITDEEALSIVKSVCNVNHAGNLHTMEKGARDSFLKIFKEQHGLSIRQIERITGINRGVILKA